MTIDQICGVRLECLKLLAVFSMACIRRNSNDSIEIYRREYRELPMLPMISVLLRRPPRKSIASDLEREYRELYRELSRGYREHREFAMLLIEL